MKKGFGALLWFMIMMPSWDSVSELEDPTGDRNNVFKIFSHKIQQLLCLNGDILFALYGSLTWSSFRMEGISTSPAVRSSSAKCGSFCHCNSFQWELRDLETLWTWVLA